VSQRVAVCYLPDFIGQHFRNGVWVAWLWAIKLWIKVCVFCLHS
jgi:hypothetical protein